MNLLGMQAYVWRCRGGGGEGELFVCMCVEGEEMIVGMKGSA